MCKLNTFHVSNAEGISDRNIKMLLGSTVGFIDCEISVELCETVWSESKLARSITP